MLALARTGSHNLMQIQLAVAAMGTRFELVMFGEDEVNLRAAGEAALEEILECDRRLSLFRRDSMLSFINRTAAERPVRLDADTFELLQTCVNVYRQSDGAFDVSVAPLMRSWGFHARPDDADPAGVSSDGLDAVIGSDQILLDADHQTIGFGQPGTAIDLGAIAKGHALDLAAEALRDAGVTSALLHGGTSTVVAIGSPPDAEDWGVALRMPDSLDRTSENEPDGEAAEPIVRLTNRAMAVSAPHGRMIEREGQRLGHVLDPRLGRPADQIPIAAVIAPTARLADAWSTAMLVLGRRPAELEDTITTCLPESADASGHAQARVVGQDSSCFNWPESDQGGAGQSNT